MDEDGLFLCADARNFIRLEYIDTLHQGADDFSVQFLNLGVLFHLRKEEINVESLHLGLGNDVPQFVSPVAELSVVLEVLRYFLKLNLHCVCLLSVVCSLHCPPDIRMFVFQNFEEFSSFTYYRKIQPLCFTTGDVSAVCADGFEISCPLNTPAT